MPRSVITPKPKVRAAAPAATHSPLVKPARRGRPPKNPADSDEGNRRRQLIDGAARLFRTKGFSAASTRDIAAAAGMRSGSPFYHFESKNALLFVVMQEGMEQAITRQLAALESLPSDAAAYEKLRVLVRHHFEVLLGPQADFIPVMLYEWRSLTPVQRKAIAQTKDLYEAAWMPVLEALHASGALRAEPSVARLFIFGALNWSVQWFSPRGGLALDALTAQALALFVGDGA